MYKTSLFRTVLLLMVLSSATVLSTTAPLVRACDKCNFLLAWGSGGYGPGQFSLPHGIAVDRDGNVYVADSSNNRIQKFDGSGGFITQWGSKGVGPGQFNDPLAIAVDSSGPHIIVYVADTRNSRVQAFDSSGGFITQWGWHDSAMTFGGSSQPMGIAVDRAGYVYVATRGQDRIEKFDSSGGLVTGWGPSWSGYGELYPLNVAVDSSGNLYVADGKTKGIAKFDMYGNYITQWGSRGSGNGQFMNPNYVAIDSFGNVYVTDSVNSCVQKFSSTGNFLLKWGSKGSGDGQFIAPLGVAVDSSGNVYVVSQDTNRVQKFGYITTTQPPVSSTTQSQQTTTWSTTSLTTMTEPVATIHEVATAQTMTTGEVTGRFLLEPALGILLGSAAAIAAAVIGLFVLMKRRPRDRSSTIQVVPSALFDISVSIPSAGKTVTLEVARDHTVASLIETIVSTVNLAKNRAYAVEYAGKLIDKPDFGKTLGDIAVKEGSKLVLRAVE